MRKIKFRVWDKERKYIFHNVVIHFVISDGDLKPVFGDKYVKDCYGDCKHYLDEKTGSLMLYTGITDKNGKEIYEGDIVKGITYKEVIACKTKAYCIGVVEIKPDTLWVEWKLPNGFRTFPDLSSKDIEVIGNIYENPELLEEGGHKNARN